MGGCWRRFVVICFSCAVFAAAARADERPPLSARIDELLERRYPGPLAAPADDAEFLRRATLDFAGRISTAQEVRAFLADAAPDKRARLIDGLLLGPAYPRRMSEAFHVALMERLGDSPDWSRFLNDAFSRNRPWNEVVRDMLAAPIDDEVRRGGAFFLSKRLENYGQNPVDLPALTRDVGRMFLGVDLQCAQCHDHLFIDDYKQRDFQGLFTFLGHTAVRADVKFPAVAEKPVAKKTEFMSVFVKQPLTTGPRLPGGREFDLPSVDPKDAWELPPDNKTGFPGRPRFSPLRILAEELPRRETRAFSRNLANRLWLLVFGRGLVHPPDLHHAGNPPSHPELLELLTDEIAAHNFDVRWMLRELALTRAYARGSRLPDGESSPPPETFAVALEKPLSAEQLFSSALEATGQADVTRRKLEAELRAADPRFAEVVTGAGRLYEERFEKALGDSRARFVAAFTSQPREPEIEFAPSVKAALFLSNDGLVLSWLEPKDGRLVERLAGLGSPGEVAEELYLAVLGRFPDAAERAAVEEHLARAGADRARSIQNLAWALLASSEFCLNH